MSFRLPSLGALRAFEAAARHANFTRAASELFVTPGAISRQIGALEEYFGFALFERTNREVKLTPAGLEYAKAITAALMQVSDATRQLLASEQQAPLRISAPLTFAMRWLMPKLVSFKARYPNNEYRLTTVVPIPLKMTSEFDVGIRILKSSPEVVAHRLFDVELVPVCSPKLLSSGPPLKEPRDLRKHVLLHSSARTRDWALWLDLAGVAHIDEAEGIQFESSSVAYEGALEGMGVAIAMKGLVTDYLASGRLVTPFEPVYRDGSAFCIVYARKGEVNHQIAAFRDWIVAEAGMPLPAAEHA
jgi:LysR family glycine cleavage system transcriptional activator